MMTDCIIWDKKIQHEGYGVAVRQRKQLLAHRVLWIEDGRDLPEGHVLHHKCGNRACVNLDHLEPLSPTEHVKLHKPRQARCHKCGEDDFHTKPDGRRRCRTCDRNRRCEEHGTVIAHYVSQDSERPSEKEEP